MRIVLKLYATLAEYLPPEAQSNAIALEVEDSCTPHAALDRFKVPHARAHLLLVNGSYVPPSDRNDHRLAEGDVIAAWPPVAGG